MITWVRNLVSSVCTITFSRSTSAFPSLVVFNRLFNKLSSSILLWSVVPLLLYARSWTSFMIFPSCSTCSSYPSLTYTGKRKKNTILSKIYWWTSVFEENVQLVRYRSKTRSKTWSYWTLPCWFDSSNHPNSFWEPFAQYISSLHNLHDIASVGCQIQIPKSKYFSLIILPSFEQLQLPEAGFDPSPDASILSLRHRSEGF